MEEQTHQLLYDLMGTYLGHDKDTIERSIVNHVEYTLASTRFDFDVSKAFLATSHSVRDHLIEYFNDTETLIEESGCKRLHYLSLEFLMGRTLQNALINLDIEDDYKVALKELGYGLEELYSEEKDAALGNGGLGRLAACFLDSMSTLGLPAWGYGIRYNYGIFEQHIKNGWQVEHPDYWLNFGNPWEIERPDIVYNVGFYGSVKTTVVDGKEKHIWEPTEVIEACAYDNPIPGYKTHHTLNLRLWRAMPSKEFDLNSFNEGDYVKALADRQKACTITSVLYPDDSTYQGRELRLKQQYFFVSATLQDVIAKFKKMNLPWSEFPNKNCFQLNDTHPSIAIPELMRLLIDIEDLSPDNAWSIVTKCISYTNHTILPEALEKWSVDMLGGLLPRHLQIIYDINWRFMMELDQKYPGNGSIKSKLSIVEESNPKQVRMANLAVIGSHHVNGVAELHTELLKKDVFPDFYHLWPDKFVNITNGVTPRRWMILCNPYLAELLNRTIDPEWTTNLNLLSELRSYVNDDDFIDQFKQVKYQCKVRLSDYLSKHLGIVVDPSSLFDIHVKRIHEYKRQLLNILYCIHRYLTLKKMSPSELSSVVPRVSIFGGKAAPAYTMAKYIIHLINCVADKVNNDASIQGKFKVVFIPNYNVSLAEIIIPAADLCHQISTAGMEASGTSNMKFAMNGSLIIGTRDGANIEIEAQIGTENMFIFGAETEQVPGIRRQLMYTPCVNKELQEVFDIMTSGYFVSVEEAHKIIDPLLKGDNYLVTYDFADYCRAQNLADETWKDSKLWNQKCIQSVAGMGIFSTDRTMMEYCDKVWKISPVKEQVVDKSFHKTRSFPRLNSKPNLGY
ncbi:hypothetical protein WA158_004609 [Blastocystis sp. Blastoise]